MSTNGIQMYLSGGHHAYALPPINHAFKTMGKSKEQKPAYPGQFGSIGDCCSSGTSSCRYRSRLMHIGPPTRTTRRYGVPRLGIMQKSGWVVSIQIRIADDGRKLRKGFNVGHAQQVSKKKRLAQMNRLRGSLPPLPSESKQKKTPWRN